MSQLTYIELDKQKAVQDSIDNRDQILIQKFGHEEPKPELSELDHIIHYDVSYAVKIDVKDAWKIDHILNAMHSDYARWYDKENMIKYLYNFFYKEYEGINRYTDYSIFPKPLQIKKSFDRVVNVGLQRTAQLITGKSQQYFTHYAWGEGTAKVLPKDTKLQLQVARIDMGINGFAEPRGSEIAFFGRFVENVPQANVWESAIFDGPGDNATMLLRTKYGGPTMTHFFQNDQIVLMHLVYQLSV